MKYEDNVGALGRGAALEGIEGEKAEEAMKTRRQLGTRMQAFAATESTAMWLIQWRGYKPKDAGHSLIGYSGTIMKMGGERAVHRANILAALRIVSDG